MKKSIVKRMTLSALIGALYFAMCAIEGPLASGFMVNVRLAEGLLVLGLFVPEVVIGCSVGCFLFNLLLGGIGPWDAVIGTSATILGGVWIILVGKFFKKDYFRLPLFGLVAVIANAFLVPVTFLIYGFIENNPGAYWLTFGVVCGGEALAIYGVGIPLYFALKKPMIKFFVDNKDEVLEEAI